MLIAYVMLTLVDIVSSKSKAEIFRLLFGVEPREFHLRELARQSDLAVRTVQQELARLKKAGLVALRRDGNRAYYSANQASPVYPDLRNLVLKTAGLVNLFRKALSHEEVGIAFLFGSVAAGTAGPGSDIDLMVVSDLGLRRLSHLISPLASIVGQEINPHVMTAEEFRQRKHKGDHFITSVLDAPRLFIKGSENELAELAK